VSAGTTSSNVQSLVMSNSNNVSFGLAGSTVTASASYPAQTAFVFSQSNGITFGTNASTVTASYNSTSAAGLGTTTAGANISLSMTLNTAGLNLSASVAAGGGGTAGSVYMQGNTTNSSSGTYPFSSLNMSGAGGLTLGQSGSSIVMSAPVVSSLSATGNFSISNNGSTISMGANAAAVSIGGNSTSAGAGYSNVSTGTVVLYGGNNITLSQNGASITISSPNAGVQGIVAGTQTMTGASTLSFINSNGVSFGLGSGASTSQITASVNPAAANSYNIVSMGTSTFGGGTGGASTSWSNTTIGFYAGSNITLSQTSNSIIIYGTSGGGGGGNITVSASNATMSAGSLVFSNSNGVSFGLNGSTITASVAAGGGNTADSYYFQGNTTNSSSGTIAQSSLNISGSGAITLGYSASSILLQVPQTSSLVGANGISVSTNGSTISVSNQGLAVSGGAGTSKSLTGITFANSNGITFGLSTGANVGTMTASYNSTQFAGTGTSVTGGASVTMSSNGLQFNGSALAGTGTSIGSTTGTMSMALNSTGLTIANPMLTRCVFPQPAVTAVSAPVNASISFQYINPQVAVTGTRLDALVSMSFSSTAGAGTQTYSHSVYAAIYTRNGSTLSSLSSGSTQYSFSMASNSAGNTNMTQAAIRAISVPVNLNMAPGEYIVGFNLVTAGTAVSLTMSMFGDNNMQTAANYAEMGSATAASQGLLSGMGVYSAASTGLSGAYSISGIVGTGVSLSQANIAIVMRNA
jgi:hypothetical protein